MRVLLNAGCIPGRMGTGRVAAFKHDGEVTRTKPCLQRLLEEPDSPRDRDRHPHGRRQPEGLAPSEGAKRPEIEPGPGRRPGIAPTLYIGSQRGDSAEKAERHDPQSNHAQPILCRGKAHMHDDLITLRDAPRNGPGAAKAASSTI